MRIRRPPSTTYQDLNSSFDSSNIITFRSIV
jgi:hypothetical protein